MRRFRRFGFLAIALVLGASCAWIYWNRPRSADLAAYIPLDCLAFVEIDSPSELIEQIQQTDAWKELADPIGVHSLSKRDRWLIGLARWTGIGSADEVLLAR